MTDEKELQKTNLLTEGSIWKKILTFAVPLFFGNLFQQLYNTVDSLVVGNFVGADALAAVGSSGSLIFLMTGLFSGIFTGAGVVISHYVGAKDFKKVDTAIHTTVAFAIAVGVFLTFAGTLLTPQILRWMGTPETVLPQSVLYFRIYFMGVITVILYNAASGIFQALGDSRHPLYYLIISSCLNVVLDLLFVAVLQTGIAGAALATILSQAVSAVLGFIRLSGKSMVCPVVFRKIQFELPMLKQILSMGIPSGLQNSVIGFANVIVQSNINAFGAAATAGCGAYFKIEGFAFLPITCFALALTTFIGQNLGAKEYERARKGARFGVLCSITLAELVGIVIYFAAPVLVAAFNDAPEVVAFGTRQARTEALFYFLLAFSHCLSGILRGAGKTAVPMFVMLLFWCVTRITYITIIVRVIPDIGMIFWAYPLTWSLSSVTFLIYYLKVDWVHALDRK